MFKPFLAWGLLCVAAVLMAASGALAQSPTGGGTTSAITNMLHNAAMKSKDRNKSEHDLKAAEKGLGDADPRVRVEALRQLRSVEDPKAEFLLLRALSDPDSRVRVKAIDILGAHGNTDATAPMSQFLFLRSTEPVVKLHIAAALGRIGDPKATRPIIHYLEETRDERARGTAVFALGEIGDSSANDALSTTATDDPSPMVRRLAQEAIEKIDGEIPNTHPVSTTKEMIPTDQRLSKMRQMDLELNQH